MVVDCVRAEEESAPDLDTAAAGDEVFEHLGPTSGQPDGRSDGRDDIRWSGGLDGDDGAGPAVVGVQGSCLEHEPSAVAASQPYPGHSFATRPLAGDDSVNRGQETRIAGTVLHRAGQERQGVGRSALDAAVGVHQDHSEPGRSQLADCMGDAAEQEAPQAGL